MSMKIKHKNKLKKSRVIDSNFKVEIAAGATNNFQNLGVFGKLTKLNS